MKKEKTIYTSAFKKMFSKLDLTYRFDECYPKTIKGKKRLMLRINDNNGRYSDIHFSSKDSPEGGVSIILDLKSDSEYNDIECGLMKFLIDNDMNEIVGYDSKAVDVHTIFAFPLFKNVSQLMITLDMMP